MLYTFLGVAIEIEIVIGRTGHNWGPRGSLEESICSAGIQAKGFQSLGGQKTTCGFSLEMGWSFLFQIKVLLWYRAKDKIGTVS